MNDKMSVHEWAHQGGKNLSKAYVEIELTPQQEKDWGRLRTTLMYNQPAFIHIFYTMMNNSKSKHVAIFSKDYGLSTACTDGVNLIINPDFFFKLDVQEQLFVVVHEIMHAVLNHCGRNYMRKVAGSVVTASGKTYPYDGDLMNVAEDFIINDMLIKGKIGKFNSQWLHNPRMGTDTESAEDVYAKVYNSRSQLPNWLKQIFDQCLPPGATQSKPPEQAVNERSDIQWGSAVASGMAAAKAMGRLPANIEAFFTELLEPKVDWTEQIKTFFARKVGSDGYDWRRPDRKLIVRDIYAPGRSGHGAGTIVVGFDTSGSIYADRGLVDRFLAEIDGIVKDVNPEKVYVVWCDAQVHRVDEVDELTDLLGLKPVGGGGTDFRPVFDWVEEELEGACDCLVYLTDTYGSFPREEPAYPVLWATTGPDSVPWGDVVVIPVEKSDARI